MEKGYFMLSNRKEFPFILAIEFYLRFLPYFKAFFDIYRFFPVLANMASPGYSPVAKIRSPFA